MAVASCEDGIDGGQDTQSVCDTLWMTNWATGRVHGPEQLTWNTGNSKMSLNHITLTYEDHTQNTYKISFSHYAHFNICRNTAFNHKGNNKQQHTLTFKYQYGPVDESCQSIDRGITAQVDISIESYTHTHFILKTDPVCYLYELQPYKLFEFSVFFLISKTKQIWDTDDHSDVFNTCLDAITINLKC